MSASCFSSSTRRLLRQSSTFCLPSAITAFEDTPPEGQPISPESSSGLNAEYVEEPTWEGYAFSTHAHCANPDKNRKTVDTYEVKNHNRRESCCCYFFMTLH